MKLQMFKTEIIKLKNSSTYVPFVAVAETWLKPHIADAQLCIDGYNIFRGDRNFKKNGGVLLYIHNDIIIDSSSSYDDGICNGVICISRKSKCFICCIYRPPNSGEDSFSRLLKFIDNFMAVHDPINKLHNYIFGDFNLPQISWNNLISTKNITPEVAILEDFMDKHFFVQYVNKNTRKGNILDLFITDNSNFVNFIKIDKISFSDHNLVTIFNTFFSTLVKDTVQKVQDFSYPDFSIFNLNTVNYTNLNKELSDVDWDKLLDVPLDDVPHILRSKIFSVLIKYSNLISKGKPKGHFCKKSSIINRKIRKLKNKMKYSNCTEKNKALFTKKIIKAIGGGTWRNLHVDLIL